MGRKPKPTALKVLAGNPGKRPLMQGEPKYPSELDLSPPQELAGEARVEWDRIAPLLRGSGVLTALDRTALRALCVCYARWLDAEAHVRNEGCVVAGSTGSPVMNPYVRVAAQALEQLRAFMGDFGMTPSSRTRIKSDRADEVKDELEEELFG